jgi:hypothetical protein
MAQLPHIDQAFIESDKISGYLLSDNHPVGGPKSAFFKRFGFDAQRPDELTVALLDHAHANDAEALPSSQHGTKYEITGPLHCPDGRMPQVKAVWIIDAGEIAPRFVTAVPA